MLLPDRPVDQERTMRPGEWRVLLAHGPFLRFLLFIVGAYLFLSSDIMSGYVTGQVIEVNGGQLMP